jgi:hypothetical protein
VHQQNYHNIDLLKLTIDFLAIIINAESAETALFFLFLTKAPIVKVKNNQISATTSEKGVVITYLITDKPISSFDKNLDWQIYSNPLIKTDKHYYFVAERIGWKVSKMVEGI